MENRQTFLNQIHFKQKILITDVDKTNDSMSMVVTVEVIHDRETSEWMIEVETPNYVYLSKRWPTLLSAIESTVDNARNAKDLSRDTWNEIIGYCRSVADSSLAAQLKHIKG